MTTRRLVVALFVLAAAVLLGPATPARAAGTCSGWTVGTLAGTISHTQWNSSFTTVGQTNMTFACLDDYSSDVTQMRVTTDPYPASVESLATTGQGEIERLRFTLKSLTGWTQWYANTENLSFGARHVSLGPQATGAGNTAQLRFLELAANGTNYVSFKAPDAITSNVTWVWPGADGTSGQQLQTNGSGTLSFATPAGVTDPYVTFDISDEFTSVRVVTGNLFVGAMPYLSNSPSLAGTPSDLNGVVSVADSTGVVASHLSVFGMAANFGLHTVSSKNPIVDLIVAQFGTAAGTRYVGLADTILNAVPTNGIYVRHVAGGNYIAVARSAGVESTLDTGVAAAASTFRKIKLTVTGTTTVNVTVDGVDKGNLTTNIPTANLGLSAGWDAITAGSGILLDFWRLRHTR